jgi:hypothetical protein
MRSPFRKFIVLRLVGLAVPGAFVLGASCADSIRESFVDGSLGFVEDTASSILEQLFPADMFEPVLD